MAEKYVPRFKKTATFVKKCNPDARGDQRLYKLSEPMEYGWEEEGLKKTEYVIVSAAVAMFSGPETYIFPANDKGDIVDWTELDGSFQGGLCHSAALEGAGYEVIGGKS